MDIAAIQQYAIEFFGEYWGPVSVVLLCGICAAISTVMPAPSETSGSIYKYLYKTINTIGLNVFKAKNADENKQDTKEESK